MKCKLNGTEYLIFTTKILTDSFELNSIHKTFLGQQQQIYTKLKRTSGKNPNKTKIHSSNEMKYKEKYKQPEQ